MSAIENYRIKLLFFLLAFLVIPSVILSQTPKGLVLTEKEAVPAGKTRALIVGISKYEYIDTLQYADRDARMFAEYLRQNNFWGIDKDDVTLLVNDKAKYGDLTVQLQRIAMISKPGDNLLFYFSGHGDVETQTLFNRGYLLAYDTYSSNYMANGLRVDDLKDLFVTLLTNNVKVIVVTDACRSGKLAGGLKGAEFTAVAISSMWKNEIKILSSQPGQLSYEDKKWGNGRGVFSYYLINGLNGDADANKDSSITLSELEVYVGSNVARETGNKQQPIFEGPNKFSTVIGKVNRSNAKINPKPPGNSFTKQPKRIYLPDDSCNYYYQQMAKAITNNKLDSRDTASASAMYHKLKTCTSDASLTLRANAELLSSLMNNAQEIVNNSFVGKNLVPIEIFEKGIDLIDQVLQYNDLKLPNTQHWKNLKRYLFVQGKATWYDDIAHKVPAEKLSLIIDSALQEEPDAAYLLTAKAAVEMQKENWNKAIQILEKAVAKSPQWLIPKYNLGICYSKTKSYSKALDYYDEILKKDTAYKTFECTKCILGKMAEWAWEIKKYKKGIEYYLLSIDHFPDYGPPYEALYDYAIAKKDTITAEKLISRLKKYDDTASMRLQRIRFEYDFYAILLSLSLPSAQLLIKNNFDLADYYYTLALVFKNERSDDDSAAYYYRKAMDLDPTEIFYFQKLIDHLNEIGYDGEAQEVLIEKKDAYQGEDKIAVNFLLAESYIKTKNLAEAFTILKEIKEAGSYTCSDLRSMRKVFGKLPAYTEYIKNCKDR